MMLMSRIIIWLRSGRPWQATRIEWNTIRL
jgi:hypothetical protein